MESNDHKRNMPTLQKQFKKDGSKHAKNNLYIKSPGKSKGVDRFETIDEADVENELASSRS